MWAWTGIKSTFFPNLVIFRPNQANHQNRSSHSSGPSHTNTFSVPDFEDEEDIISDEDDDDIMETDKPVIAQTATTDPQAMVPIDLTSVSPALKAQQEPNFSATMTFIHLESDVIDLTSEHDAHNTDIDLEASSEPSLDTPDSETSSARLYVGGYYDDDEDYPSSEAPHVSGYGDSDGESLLEADHLDDDDFPTSPGASGPQAPSRVFGAYSPLYESDSDDESFTSEAHVPGSVVSSHDSDLDISNPVDEGGSGDENEILELLSNGEQPVDQGVDFAEHNGGDDKGESFRHVYLLNEPGQANRAISDFERHPSWDEDMSGDEDEQIAMDSNYIDEPEELEQLKELSPMFHCPRVSPFPRGINSYNPASSSNSTRPMHASFYSNTYSLHSENPRQASPSDAVMAKSHPLKAPCIPSSTTQILGQRTGKYEFFAARDQNRASILSNSLVLPTSCEQENNAAAVQLHPTQTNISGAELAENSTPATLQPPWRDPVSADEVLGTVRYSNRSIGTIKSDKNELHQVDCGVCVSDSNAGMGEKNEIEAPTRLETEYHSSPMADIVLDSNHDQKQPTSVWTPHGEAFLKEPLLLSNERTRFQSPEPDMTSAATFMESKKKSDSDGTRARRRLAIKSLLSQEPKETSPNPNNNNSSSDRPAKRSYDEVFSEEEQACSPEAHQPPIGSAMLPIESDVTPSLGSVGQMSTSTKMGIDACTASHTKTAPTDCNKSPLATKASRATLVIPTAPVEQPDIRPAKKRRFGKLAKYASVSVVSGVTSAALLFAGLAATAPQIV